jgi:hypothetical protein
VAAVAALAVLGATASARDRGWTGWCRHGSPGVERTSATCGARIVDGRAVAPPSAPPPVRAAIAAANRIDGKPYVWGGGHLRWWAKGYDCSGAVGYVLHSAGLLDVTLVSGELGYWGEGGSGRWITVYANDHHTYMVIAGLRFDTRDDPPGVTGPRWHEWMVDAHRFVARHPRGL